MTDQKTNAICVYEPKPSMFSRFKQAVSLPVVKFKQAVAVSPFAKFKKALRNTAVVLSTMMFTSYANAALDVATVVEEIKGNSTSVQTIMLAVLAIGALFVGFAFIKRAMR